MIAPRQLDACLLTTPPRTTTVRNTPAGHAQLLAWAAAGLWHVCLEATSTYGFPIARHAYAAGHTVSVLQPLAVQRYAQATLSRNKTDRLDAALVADFGRTQNPRPWTPPSPAQEQLPAQSRLRDELVQQRQGLQNRLDTAHPPAAPFIWLARWRGRRCPRLRGHQLRPGDKCRARQGHQHAPKQGRAPARKRAACHHWRGPRDRRAARSRRHRDPRFNRGLPGSYSACKHPAPNPPPGGAGARAYGLNRTRKNFAEA